MAQSPEAYVDIEEAAVTLVCRRTLCRNGGSPFAKHKGLNENKNSQVKSGEEASVITSYEARC